MKTGTKVAITAIAVAAVAGGIYWWQSAGAQPGEYCCPYCGECFATYEELVEHVKTAHPGERIPLPIEWD